MNNYYWSLDISTTNIGFALWNNKGELVELKHLELKTNKSVTAENRDIVKAELFRKYVTDYRKRIETELNGEITNIIVEAPLAGSNNSNTVSLLYGFNGICRYILYETFGTYPIKISVYDSRKLFLPELVHQVKKKGEYVDVLSFPDEYKDNKKLYIWEKVNRLEPMIEWFYDKTGKLKDTNFDMSDSYCVGYAGLKYLEIIN